MSILPGASEARFRSLTQLSADWYWEQDAQFRFTEVSDGANSKLSIPTSNVLGKTRWELNSINVSEATWQQHRELLQRHESFYDFELRRYDAQGRLRVVLSSGEPLFNKDGEFTGYRGIGRDITEKALSEELIWKHANFDALTSLPNRRMFHDRLEQEIKKANRDKQRLAVLFLDLDEFKEVNDTLGHDQGDRLLCEAARRISDCVRDTDTVARLGGDEFTVLLTQLDDFANVDRVALNILDKLAKPFELQSEAVQISASIGITVYPNDASDVEALMQNADQAMYVAKKLGRNCLSHFTASLQQAAHQRMRLIHDLRGAVGAGQLRLAFQPIVELASGRVHKAEALLRWQHPERGLVSPLDFIALAEETGLIMEIGDWVFKQSARWVKGLPRQSDAAFQVSVNVSPVQFSKESSFANWFSHLKELDLPSSALVIEITEGLLMKSDTLVTRQLLALQQGGLAVAIDDFGTGYSALSYLNKFHVDYLKIDQSFTRNIAPGSSDLILSEAIIVMAHKLGLKVIAEGVETAQQRDLLNAIAYDYGQGYFWSRPLPEKDFAAWLPAQPPGSAAPT